MKTLNTLLDAALAKTKLPSDRQLAKKLRVSPSAISLWRQGKAIKDSHLADLIKLADADPVLAVAVRQEMAETPAERQLWGPLLDRLSAAAAVVALAALLPFGVKAKPVDIQALTQADSAKSVYYVVRQLLARMLHRLRPRTGWSLTHA